MSLDFRWFWAQVAIAALCECHKILDNAIVADSEFSDVIKASDRVAQWIRGKHG
jgi:hypothetical protein